MTGMQPAMEPAKHHLTNDGLQGCAGTCMTPGCWVTIAGLPSVHSAAQHTAPVETSQRPHSTQLVEYNTMPQTMLHQRARADRPMDLSVSIRTAYVPFKEFPVKHPTKSDQKCSGAFYRSIICDGSGNGLMLNVVIAHSWLHSTQAHGRSSGLAG